VAITEADRTDCLSIGRSKMRFRSVKYSGIRMMAKSCTTTKVGQGDASGTV